jgi:hypothetical protein
MANEKSTINLLPNKEEGFLPRFLSWGLSVGRLLIILTETLALGTFLYRFNLDMKIVDLHDAIKSESFIVKLSGKSEDAYRNLQKRLLLANTYASIGSTTPTIFKDIAEMGRNRVTFKNLVVTNTLIQIEAESPSSESLSTFINALKQYPAVKDISVDKVENNTSTATIIVAVTANLKTSQANPNLIAQPTQSVDQGL